MFDSLWVYSMNDNLTLFFNKNELKMRKLAFAIPRYGPTSFRSIGQILQHLGLLPSPILANYNNSTIKR